MADDNDVALRLRRIAEVLGISVSDLMAEPDAAPLAEQEAELFNCFKRIVDSDARRSIVELARKLQSE